MKKKLKKIYLKIKHWCCKVGLCNLDSCNCNCHEGEPKTTVVKNAQEDNLKKVIEARQPISTKKASRLSLTREERRRLKKLN